MKLENLQPTSVAKTLTPKRNSLLFFEVSDKSFHQVSEVLAKNKTSTWMYIDGGKDYVRMGAGNSAQWEVIEGV